MAKIKNFLNIEGQACKMGHAQTPPDFSMALDLSFTCASGFLILSRENGISVSDEC